MHGRSTDQQSLLAPAPVQQPVSEDMAAVEIGAKLNFIHRHESKVEVARHRLDGRDPVARRFRLDFFLAGNQRDSGRAGFFHRAVIDLACEQPERQADHPAGMGKHPLDGVMRLAGIGRPEQHIHAAGAVRRTGFGGRKGNVHWLTGAGKRFCARGSGDGSGLSGCDTARFAWNGPGDCPRLERRHAGTKPFRATSRLALCITTAPLCITLRPPRAVLFRVRTRDERIAPESLTCRKSLFVHHNIWIGKTTRPQKLWKTALLAVLKPCVRRDSEGPFCQ